MAGSNLMKLRIIEFSLFGLVATFSLRREWIRDEWVGSGYIQGCFESDFAVVSLNLTPRLVCYGELES